MANTLTREQLAQTWQGLQALTKGVPASFVKTTDIEGLSDEALLARIDAQQIAIDNNTAIGVSTRPKVNLNAPLDLIDEDEVPAAPSGARDAAISTLKSAITNPAATDMMFFHALLGSYSEGQNFTIPDFAFDDQISEGELTAAEEIARRLEAGERAPQIEAAFAQSATSIEEAQRQAAIAAEELKARQEAALRQQNNLETSVDSHLAAMGYIDPEQIGALSNTQRANAMSAFMREHGEILTTPGTPTAEMGTLSAQQRLSLDANNEYAVRPDALTILTTGRAGEQMADEVQNWLESGEPRQIMMAQATLGLPVSGEIDAVTNATALAYIHKPYPTSLDNVAFVQNSTGGINPSAVYDAANRGTLHMPTIEELRAAGVDEATLESISAAKPASELLPARDALAGKPFEEFTDADQAIWTADTREELIASRLMDDPALYARIIEAHNQVAASATLNVTLNVDTTASAAELAVIDLNNPPADLIVPVSLTDKVEGDAPLSVLDERVIAANPLGLEAPNPDVLGGSSDVAGTYYNNGAIAKTPEGTLVFDGPDVSLDMVVKQLRPNDGTMTMDEALRSVHAMQTTNQELFLSGATGMSDAPTMQDGARIAQTLGYEPDHEFDFSNPTELHDMLTGVYAYNNRMLIPDGTGNYVDRFINSSDESIVAMRDSITRVAEGHPLLTSAPVMIADTDPAAPATDTVVTADAPATTRSLGVDNTVTGALPAEGAPVTGDQSLWVHSDIEVGGMSTPATDEFINPDGSFNGSFASGDVGNINLANFSFNGLFGTSVEGPPPLTAPDPDLQSAVESLAARKAGALDSGPTGMQ